MKYLQTLDFDFIEVAGFKERPFRAKFIPAKVWDDLDTYKNDPTGLKNYFKKWKMKVEFKPHKRPSPRASIGGWYLPDSNSSIIDIWCDDFKRQEFSERSWNRFKYKIIQVAMHELIHSKQYMGKHEDYAASTVKYRRTGNKKIDDNRQYYSGRDEIEAYAHCIYLDFRMRRPNANLIQLLRESKSKPTSSTLSGIMKVFKKDTTNQALPLLARKILTWERKYKQFA